MIDPSTILTAINTVLIVGTIVLGVSTYTFQKRTSLRESLEQLDSLWVEHRKEYIGVFLHQFSYFPLLKDSAVLKFYVRHPTPEEKANVGMIRNAEQVLGNTYEMAPQDLLKHDLVVDAWLDNTGLFIKTNSVNSVKCRSLAEKIQIDLEVSVVDGDEIPPS